MKKILTFFALASFFVINTSDAGETGRYQLFQGEHQVFIKGEEFLSKALYKIDTVSGEVWIGEQEQFVDEKGESKQRRAWRPFEQELKIIGQKIKK